MDSKPIPPLTPSNYNPFATYEKNGTRFFTNGALQSAIDLAAKEVGDSQVAVVAHHEFDQHGNENTNVTKLSAIAKTKDGKFSIMVGAFKDWGSGDLGAGAKVAWKPF